MSLPNRLASTASSNRGTSRLKQMAPRDSADDSASIEIPEQDAGGTRTRPARRVVATSDANPFLWAFLFTLVLPMHFWVGSLYLPPMRAFLVFAMPVCLFMWLSGAAGKKVMSDWLIIIFVLWATLSTAVVHGYVMVETSGIFAIETLGAYFVGRVFVKGATDIKRVVKFLRIILIILIVPTLIESIFAYPVVLKFFDAIGTTYHWMSSNPKYGERLGMYRAQGMFQHPILFGIFCGSAFALMYYARSPKTNKPGGFVATLPSGFLTFMSLSSGAYLTVMASVAFIMWDRIMGNIRRHWIILLWIMAATYVAIDLLSNRSPIEVFISKVAFSGHNAYMRVNIFVYGMENVWAHPIFGIGFADWERPKWLHADSVDNYWLLLGMRYGIPGFLLMSLTWVFLIVKVSRLRLPSLEMRELRVGWIISMVASAVSLATVHMWGALYLWLLFLLGAGGCFVRYAANVPPGTPYEEELSDKERRQQNRQNRIRAGRVGAGDDAPDAKVSDEAPQSAGLTRERGVRARSGPARS